MNVYHRKLYALLYGTEIPEWGEAACQGLQCLSEHLPELRAWWGNNNQQGSVAAEIGSSSDRVNLKSKPSDNSSREVRHPISGESQIASVLDALNDAEIERLNDIVKQLANSSDREEIANNPETTKKIFWWFWRFYPDFLTEIQPTDEKKQSVLLFPAHRILPDCPIHSYGSTVSALTGAMFPEGWNSEKPERPYLLLFTFSPVQEFIKSSRKFLDFWAGSYLLHYLSVKVCWYIAETYGPDAVITPSLWNQEIIDALIVEKYPDVEAYFACFSSDGKAPVSRFNDRDSTSLSTAGFPNVITAIVPGKAEAEKLGKELTDYLKQEWSDIGKNVKNHIKTQVINFLCEKQQQIETAIAQLTNFQELTSNDELIKAIALTFPKAELIRHLEELQKWQQPGCWEWNKLWDAQLDNTWEPYWSAIPLGNPSKPLSTESPHGTPFDATWKEAQQQVAQALIELPATPEELAYERLNVGTWWGSLQARLGESLRGVKNLRTWQIPAAPGERSTISGQFSAAHPHLHYAGSYREGSGLSASSMRLFWLAIAKAFPGLFNGSEKLNCLELTKRMAWQYGGVAKFLGISIQTERGEIDWEGLIRFPNLSSIAAARFACDRPHLVREYWQNLKKLITNAENGFSDEHHRAFYSKTQRPFHVSKTNKAMQQLPNYGKGYNGVMFSSKWLADDMSLQGDKVATLRRLIDQAHKKSNFGEGSPADWWAIVLGDGDGMGNYVSGETLKPYKDYIVDLEVAPESKQVEGWDKLVETKKRMGPATHVGLNRALLDFSNRLVPYLTEQRFCGKVIYSGGDDVMAVLPIEDLPEYLLSLRAAWCGDKDPFDEFEYQNECGESSGYWKPKPEVKGLPHRPLFTMGKGATISIGIAIAHKSIPLPTVLETLWEAEKDRAKKLPGKDGLCFRVIYGGGNQLEALMKGHLLEGWWNFIKDYNENLSPLLYRLAEELPRRASVTQDYKLFSQAAKVILSRRDEEKMISSASQESLIQWLNAWEDWVKKLKPETEDWGKWLDNLNKEKPFGTQPEDLGKLLRFSAFWVDKMVERQKWGKSSTSEDS